jgi:hypothetical protein
MIFIGFEGPAWEEARNYLFITLPKELLQNWGVKIFHKCKFLKLGSSSVSTTKVPFSRLKDNSVR